MKQVELRDLAEVALAAAQAGAQVLMTHLNARNEDLVIRAKRDGSPVSAADLASHEAILHHLGPTGIPIISEEGSLPPYSERKNWPWFWLVDPLDGTESFLHHREGFAVNIALCNVDGPVLGLVSDPLSDTAYLGIAGDGVQQVSCNAGDRRSLQPGPAEKPYRLVTSRNEIAGPEELVPPGLLPEDIYCEPVSGALKFCLLATGEADIHARTGSYMEWDCAAGDGILRAIGLTTFDLHTGEQLRYNSPTLRVEGLWVSRV
jgi:3'(2'), 5'-bisphosphate nucleotidase